MKYELISKTEEERKLWVSFCLCCYEMGTPLSKALWGAISDFVIHWYKEQGNDPEGPSLPPR